MTETIQQLKEDIAILQEKLQKLEELEITKTPCEIAYKDWWGEYPPTNPSVDNIFDIRWRAFQMGYNAADTQKLIDEEDNDKNFKNSLDLIKEWGEKNKPPTLYEKLEEWVDYGNFSQSKDVLVNEIVNIVKDWLPPSNDKNSYEWEKCLKMMYGNLR